MTIHQSWSIKVLFIEMTPELDERIALGSLLNRRLNKDAKLEQLLVGITPGQIQDMITKVNHGLVLQLGPVFLGSLDFQNGFINI